MAKKNLAITTIIVFAIIGLIMWAFVDKYSSERTVRAFLEQRTQLVNENCVYWDGIKECSIAKEYCLKDSSYSVNLGLCDNLQLNRKFEAARAGLDTFAVTSFKPEVNGGERNIFQGQLIVETDGKYLIEAGMDFTQWQALPTTARAATQYVVERSSVCDESDYFASGIVSAKKGDIIKFNLQPKVPNEEGTFNYYITVTDGCYKDGTPQTYDQKGPFPVKITKVAEEVIPEETPAETPTEEVSPTTEVTAGEDTKKLIEDIQKDFPWIKDMNQYFTTKYLLYGGIGLIVLLIIVALLRPSKRPPQSGYPRV